MSEQDNVAQQDAPVNRPAIDHRKIAGIIAASGLGGPTNQVITQLLGEFGYVPPGTVPGYAEVAPPQTGEVWIDTVEMTTAARRNAYMAASKLIEIRSPNEAVYVTNGEAVAGIWMAQYRGRYCKYADSMAAAKTKLVSGNPLHGVVFYRA